MFKQFLGEAGYITIPFPANFDKGNIVESIANHPVKGSFDQDRNGSYISKAFLTCGHTFLEVSL